MAQTNAEPPKSAQTYEGTGASPAGGPQGESYSGETLVVLAYAFVWIAVFVFVAVAWRRTRGLESRLDQLERALEKARAEVPRTKRSASEP